MAYRLSRIIVYHVQFQYLYSHSQPFRFVIVAATDAAVSSVAVGFVQ